MGEFSDLQGFAEGCKSMQKYRRSIVKARFARASH